jgi:low temperature requirement protein LtrA
MRCIISGVNPYGLLKLALCLLKIAQCFIFNGFIKKKTKIELFLFAQTLLMVVCRFYMVILYPAGYAHAEQKQK